MATNKIDPLKQEELETLFFKLSSMKSVVIAVSGGPDSMALMAALARWREGRKLWPALIVASVDHGLRPEAAQEATMVRCVAERLGLKAHILHWEGVKPETGIQEAARNERYRLLFSLCHDEQADALVTAHTEDDQAETVLMRLARGSGLSGLRGMNPCREVGSVQHLRPLLNVEKSRLIASCQAWGIDYVIDPSNESPRYTRVRWRQMMPNLAAEGLDAYRLNRLASRMARADEALQKIAITVFERLSCFRLEQSKIELDAFRLHQEPLEIIIRVYHIALMQFPPAERHLRLERLESCVEFFSQAVEKKHRLRRNLSGVLISLNKNGQLIFQREPVRKVRKTDIFVNLDVENVAD